MPATGGRRSPAAAPISSAISARTRLGTTAYGLHIKIRSLRAVRPPGCRPAQYRELRIRRRRRFILKEDRLFLKCVSTPPPRWRHDRCHLRSRSLSANGFGYLDLAGSLKSSETMDGFISIRAFPRPLLRGKILCSPSGATRPPPAWRNTAPIAPPRDAAAVFADYRLRTPVSRTTG